MLELYHWEPVANSAEPLICLAEKGLDFTSHYVDILRCEQHSPAFLRLNPQGQVPVLVHDARVLTETTLILEYLEAAFPAVPLLPSAPAERYRLRAWAKFAAEYFAPALAVFGWHTCMAPKLQELGLAGARAGLARLPLPRQLLWQAALEDSYSAEELENARLSLQRVARRLEQALAEHDCLAGGTYSLADIAVFPMANALPELLPELVSRQSAPRTLAWLEGIRARPAVAAVLGAARVGRPERLFAPGPEPSRWG